MFRLRLPRLRVRQRRIGFAGASAIAAVGTLFYSRRVIHADSPEEDFSVMIHTILAHPGELVSPSGINRRSDPDEGPPEILKDEDVVRMQLRSLSGFGTIDGETGISRFDSISIPSSVNRLDTTHVSSNRMSSGSSWTIFTLHEGFGVEGWGNMVAVSQALHAMLASGLVSLFSKYEPSAEHSEVGGMTSYQTHEDEGFDDAVINNIKETFLEVDNSIVRQPFEFLTSSTTNPPPKSLIISCFGPAVGGSSALSAFYDHEPRKLRVANVGNTRAVLGRKASGNKEKQTYTAHVLSDDQTTDSAPGLSRAFGLGPYKWTRDLQERLHRDFMGDAPLIPSPKTNITAEPTVTTTDIRPGDFMVLATHGLWKSLTNEEVVGLVGLWINRDMKSLTPEARTSIDVVMPSDLPASLEKDNTVTYKQWGKEKRFTCVDNNAAQHLLRNALGGADVQWTAQLLATQPPRAEKFRDDLSVTVIFFSDTADT